MKSKLLILLSLFAFVGGAHGSQKTYWAQLTAESKGVGKVYVTTSQNASGTGKTTDTQKSSANSTGNSANVSLYAHADGFDTEEYHVYWTESETDDNNDTRNNTPNTYQVQINSSSTNQNNPATKTIYAYFHKHTYSNGTCSACQHQHATNKHEWSSEDGKCTICKKTCTHTWVDGECITCHYQHPADQHNYSNGVCSLCHYQHPADQHDYVSGTCSICKYKHPADQHNYDKGECTICHYVHKESEHSYNPENSTCTVCGFVCTSHSWTNGECTKCHYLHPADQHNYVNGTCSECKYKHPADQHSYDNGVCTVCQLSHANHQYDADGLCTTCHIFQYSKSNENTLKAIAQIANPRFDNASSASWETSNEGGNVNFVSTNAVEFFNNQHFNIQQTLTDIPNGKYIVSVQGFYRAGSRSVAYNNRAIQNAYLYAKVGSAEVKRNLANLVEVEEYRWIKPTGYEEDRDATIGMYVIPDDINGANSAITNTKLTARVEVEVTNNTLTIGVKDNGQFIADQWVYLDNFSLTCESLSTQNYTFAAGQTELDLSTAGEILPTKFNKQNSPNALIFASNIAGIKDAEGKDLTENVVVKDADGNYTCEELVLVDEINGAFSTSIPFTAIKAKYTRENQNGDMYGTIYLPYKVATTNAIQYCTLTGASKDNLTIDETDEIEAYTPAIYKVTGEGSTLEFSASNVVVPESQGSEGELVGVLQATAVCDSEESKQGHKEGYTPVIAENSYYIKSDQFWLMNKRFNIKPFRAYLNFGDVLNVRAESLSIGLDDLETAIDAIDTQNSELKIFDLSGRRLEKLQKGVNIVNGKKVLVK